MGDTNYNDSKLSGKNMALAVQHLFAMFGATVLVPLLTGLNVSLGLVCAGVGTLIFHVLTKFKVPVFLGSSFAFIPAIAAVVATQGQPAAQGGIIVAGLVYVVLSAVIYFVGVQRIRRLFPTVVTGPVIIVIGLGLSYSAVNNTGLLNAGQPLSEGGVDWIIALVTLVVVIVCTIWAKGFFKLVPILIGMASGYLLCVILHFCGVYHMDFSPVTDAAWVNIPYVTENFFTVPKFDATAIIAIAPIAIVSFMEHMGDISTNGTVVGKDFMKDPGLHRTVLGDGIATLVAGLLGGPANTTYSENTGVLATTKNYNPFILRITAVFAIVLGFFGKFGGVLQTIPAPVLGGVSLVLYGMIASVGIRSLAEAKLDFTDSKNLLIVAVILCLGIGISIASYADGSTAGIQITIAGNSYGISGLFVSVLVGIILNLILPDSDKADKKAEE